MECGHLQPSLDGKQPGNTAFQCGGSSIDSCCVALPL